MCGLYKKEKLRTPAEALALAGVLREGIETQYIQIKSAGSILWNEQGKRITFLRFNLLYNVFC